MKIDQFFKSKVFFAILSFIVSFIVYVLTLAPTVSFIDSGELATVCIKLGVAHPTGYPLFTILGNLFSKIPIGEELYRLNLMSAVLSSLGVLIFFNLVVFLFKDLNFNIFNKASKTEIKSSKRQKEKVKNISAAFKLDSLSIYFIALSSSLILAFSLTYWSSANSIEVYSLHSLFLISLIYIFLKACNSINSWEVSFLRREKYWLAFAFVLGLSFTNHLTTLFLGIGTIYLYFGVNGFNKNSLQRISYMIIPFIIGLSVYMYLPLRADNPILSWGNPYNFENFYRHISGKQFSVWMFSSTENAEKQFSYFIANFPKEFYYIPSILAIFGLVKIFKKYKRLFNYTILLFIFTVLYAINYDIYDIDSYFLLAYIVSVTWIAFGVLFVVEKFKKSALNLSIASILLCILPLSANYELTDESDNYFVRDFTYNVFKSAPENSIIMSSEWDFWVSASLYYQFVKDIRKDIVVIDKELLRKSWYLDFVKIHYSDIYERSKNEFEIYKSDLINFERETSRYTNPVSDADKQLILKIQGSFHNLLNSILENNQDRNFYTTFEIEQASQEKFGNDYVRIPEGLLIKYSKENRIDDNYMEPEFEFQVTKKDSYHHTFIMNAYYNSFLSRANYVMNFSKYDDAERLINQALKVKPQGPEALRLLNKLNQLRTLQNQ
ncbi:MAG: DUF2723 domain-containing protein [Ignavibacteria bacterium]|nr:DUF2723 domain-containing protein [Ignavibacteria bacterium]